MKSHSLFDKIIIKITLPLALSFFVMFYVIFPLFNIIRSFFLLKTNIFFFLSFLFSSYLYVFNLILSLWKELLDFFLEIFFLKYKKILSFGALLTRDKPVLFSFYLIFSITSLRLVYLAPDNFCIHFFYILSVIFRNLFLIFYLGYLFLIKLNQKQEELLIENYSADKMSLFLWKNTKLIQDPNFLHNFENWAKWVQELTPSEKSLKIISIFSLSTSIYWYFLLVIYHTSNDFIKVFTKNKNDFDESIEFILQNNAKKTELDDIIKEIGLTLKNQLEVLNKEINSYSEMNSLFFSFLFLWFDKFEEFVTMVFF